MAAPKILESGKTPRQEGPAGPGWTTQTRTYQISGLAAEMYRRATGREPEPREVTFHVYSAQEAARLRAQQAGGPTTAEPAKVAAGITHESVKSGSGFVTSVFDSVTGMTTTRELTVAEYAALRGESAVESTSAPDQPHRVVARVDRPEVDTRPRIPVTYEAHEGKDSDREAVITDPISGEPRFSIHFEQGHEPRVSRVRGEGGDTTFIIEQNGNGNGNGYTIDARNAQGPVNLELEMSVAKVQLAGDAQVIAKRNIGELEAEGENNVVVLRNGAKVLVQAAEAQCTIIGQELARPNIVEALTAKEDFGDALRTLLETRISEESLAPIREIADPENDGRVISEYPGGVVITRAKDAPAPILVSERNEFYLITREGETFESIDVAGTLIVYPHITPDRRTGERNESIFFDDKIDSTRPHLPPQVIVTNGKFEIQNGEKGSTITIHEAEAVQAYGQQTEKTVRPVRFGIDGYVRRLTLDGLALVTIPGSNVDPSRYIGEIETTGRNSLNGSSLRRTSKEPKLQQFDEIVMSQAPQKSTLNVRNEIPKIVADSVAGDRRVVELESERHHLLTYLSVPELTTIVAPLLMVGSINIPSRGRAVIDQVYLNALVCGTGSELEVKTKARDIEVAKGGYATVERLKTGSVSEGYLRVGTIERDGFVRLLGDAVTEIGNGRIKVEGANNVVNGVALESGVYLIRNGEILSQPQQSAVVRALKGQSVDAIDVESSYVLGGDIVLENSRNARVSDGGRLTVRDTLHNANISAASLEATTVTGRLFVSGLSETDIATIEIDTIAEGGLAILHQNVKARIRNGRVIVGEGVKLNGADVKVGAYEIKNGRLSPLTIAPYQETHAGGVTQLDYTFSIGANDKGLVSLLKSNDGETPVVTIVGGDGRTKYATVTEASRLEGLRATENTVMNAECIGKIRRVDGVSHSITSVREAEVAVARGQQSFISAQTVREGWATDGGALDIEGSLGGGRVFGASHMKVNSLTGTVIVEGSSEKEVASLEITGSNTGLVEVRSNSSITLRSGRYIIPQGSTNVRVNGQLRYPGEYGFYEES